MSDGTTNKSEDDMPLVGYLITVGEILRFEGRKAWADNISKAASKINKMQDEIEKLRAALKPFADAADDLEEGETGSLWDRPAAMNITCDDLRNSQLILNSSSGTVKDNLTVEKKDGPEPVRFTATGERY